MKMGGGDWTERNGYVVTTYAYGAVCLEDGTYVTASDTIIANYNYITELEPGANPV